MQKPKGERGLPGSSRYFMFTLAAGSRTSGEVHVFPAYHILWCYLASLCRGDWEPAVRELSISRSAALCRQFLALESQDIGTEDVNVLKHRPNPCSTPRVTLRNSSLGIGSVTDGQNHMPSSRAQRYHSAVSHDLPSVQAQQLIQPISPSTAGFKARPQMLFKKQTLRLQPAH